MDLIRDLHPEQIAEQYEVVNFWTVFPDANPRRPSVEPPGLPDYSGLNEPRGRKGSEARWRNVPRGIARRGAR